MFGRQQAKRPSVWQRPENPLISPIRRWGRQTRGEVAGKVSWEGEGAASKWRWEQAGEGAWAETGEERWMKKKLDEDKLKVQCKDKEKKPQEFQGLVASLTWEKDNHQTSDK